ncbi:MAG: class I SAM-dependent methyltransferase [Hyphomicrobiaceae bacterium]
MTRTYSRTFGAPKADFDRIYIEPDPRLYFVTLGALDYVIPDVAGPVFEQLVRARKEALGRRITVLDIGCSYGINAALLKYGLSFPMLYDRYASRRMPDLTTEEMVAYDRRFYASWPPNDDVRIIGMDSSAAAVTYAKAVGLIDDGIIADLENDEPTAADRKLLAEVDLVISTGCVGYITQRTFEQLEACRSNGEPPWVASFVLRMYGFKGIARVLERQGLVTEKFDGATFAQRRFADETEMRKVIAALSEGGIDTGGKESEGMFHAELYVSRPAEVVKAMPLRSKISIVSGAHRRYAQRQTPVAAVLSLEDEGARC